MTSLHLWTPHRRTAAEILDDPGIDPHVVVRSMRDVTLSNALLGGSGAVIAELRLIMHELPRSASMLDVGTGLGDIPRRAQRLCRSHGIGLYTVGLDAAHALARASRTSVNAAVRGDAVRLPFADRSFDVVICSQVLHHFAGDRARALIEEMTRVARTRVVVSDLLRSRLAAAALWVMSFPLGFHPISRHDGVASVLRGFTPDELRDLVMAAVGHRARVVRRRGFRITATWHP